MEHPVQDADSALLEGQQALTQAADNTLFEEQQALAQEYFKELSTVSQQNTAYANELSEVHKVNEQLEKKIEALTVDYEQFQNTSREYQEQNRILLHEHQQTIHEQRENLEKKQQQITLLEGQVRDLHYEIKTLMEVEERQSIVRFPTDRFPSDRLRQREFEFVIPTEEDEDLAPPPQVHCAEEASQQLKRCLDIAQKITGGQYMNQKPSRLKDLPVENTALEMRRLFDNLRSENQATILLYSPKENKLLFVNNPIKSILGWSPDKFVQQFSSLVIEGAEAWKQSINQLSFKNESYANLLIASKAGHHVSVNCHLGLIPTGSFRHYVLAVLYPA